MHPVIRLIEATRSAFYAWALLGAFACFIAIPVGVCLPQENVIPFYAEVMLSVMGLMMLGPAVTALLIALTILYDEISHSHERTIQKKQGRPDQEERNDR